jgi:plasmid stabilization system protein ParE
VSAAFKVRYTDPAREDLLWLFDFLLDRARTAEDFDSAQHAIDVIRDTVERSLSRAPFICRKAGDSPFLRELLISFGGSGHVALYEIVDAAHVMVLALRHQLEDDYH